MKSVNMEFCTRLADIRFTALCDILAVCKFVYMIEHKQHDHHVKEQYREQMQAPEERNTSHKAHQKRRISDRSQAAAHVGYHEDKEYHDMAFSFSPGIHLDHWTDHQHTGTCCSDTAG